MDKKCIPTAIYFPPNSDRIFIGYKAKKMLHSDPENVIYDIKRIMGRNKHDSEVMRFKKKHKFKLTDDEYPRIIIPNRNIEIRSEQALAAVLIHLVKKASDDLKVPYMRDVIVSMPAIFHDGQRRAVYNAAEIAGLNVKYLGVEPSMASIGHIYYAKEENKESLKNLTKDFMVFDFGGGTLDCSRLRCTTLKCTVLGISGNSSLGGIDFDHVIENILEKKGKDELQWVITKKLKAEIMSKSEAAKQELSEKEYTTIALHDEHGYIKEVKITLKEFEDHPMTQQLLDSAVKTAKEAMKKKYSQDTTKSSGQGTVDSNLRAVK